jgi:glucose/arabinose dehydrogenase
VDLMMRRLLPLALAATLPGLVASGQTWPADLQLVTVIASGLTNPVALRHAGDGSGRLFVVERAGVIRVWTGTQVLATPFLNISALVDSTSFDERGLLGLDFHPSYEANGYFYVYYTANSPSGALRIARYRVTADPNVADPNSALTILEMPHPNVNHNGGDLHFGPDGFLYIGTGDGGGSNDPDNNAQNVDTLLGKMLRIDVDNPAPPRNYGIPPGNPFAGAVPGADEIWHLGLRNPWRWSFDRLTGDLLIGDVGQGQREEVDFQAAAAAPPLNFQWDCWEGTRQMSAGEHNNPVCATFTGGAPPILEYTHSFGTAVSGGYRYRGPVGGLRGRYFYADYGSGRIWIAVRSAGGAWSTAE